MTFVGTGFMNTRPLILVMALALCFLAGPHKSFADTGEELKFYQHGDLERGREKFIRFQCARCHQVEADSGLPAPEEGVPAPVLGTLRAKYGTEELANAILSPAHTKLRQTRSSETSSPETANSQTGLRNQDLIDLVTYLRAAQE